MRKLDTLILKSFIGPFVLTTAVATFILLIQYMLKYFDDFVGKNLGFSVFAELIFYFSLNMLQVALPLGVLVSSLMTFGNLGENFELTAIKGAGISLLRALRPIFFFVLLLSVGAFFFNDYVVPAANLKAYSLLYDIKHKKPALDIREGVFYNGIPEYSIKVKEKLPDNKTLKDVMIYDHTSGAGNNRVILADSSRMLTMYNDKYLKLELFNGNYYSEQPKAREPVDQLFRTNFDRMDLVFSLSSFDLKRTKEELFQNNRQMKNIRELTRDIDSMKISIKDAKRGFYANAKGFFNYHLKVRKLDTWMENEKKEEEKADSKPVRAARNVKAEKLQASFFPSFDTDTIPKQNPPEMVRRIKHGMHGKFSSFSDSLPAIKGDTLIGDAPEEVAKEDSSALDTLSWAYLDSKIESRYKQVEIAQVAKSQAQNIKVNLTSISSRIESLQADVRRFIIEKWKKFSQAFACIVMFLIGAPLGSIIKKGGMGVPAIISIFFFIVYYVLTIMSEKWAKEGMMNPVWAVWTADIFLLPIGLFFLRQARIDARLFDVDVYVIWLDRLKARFLKK